jgi:hypothetical protein
MTNFSHLFSNKAPSVEMEDTISAIENSIDTVIAKGSSDTEVLEMMKDLLQEISINTSIMDYIDEVNKDG